MRFLQNTKLVAFAYALISSAALGFVFHLMIEPNFEKTSQDRIHQNLINIESNLATELKNLMTQTEELSLDPLVTQFWEKSTRSLLQSKISNFASMHRLVNNVTVFGLSGTVMLTSNPDWDRWVGTRAFGKESTSQLHGYEIERTLGGEPKSEFYSQSAETYYAYPIRNSSEEGNRVTGVLLVTLNWKYLENTFNNITSTASKNSGSERYFLSYGAQSLLESQATKDNVGFADLKLTNYGFDQKLARIDLAGNQFLVGTREINLPMPGQNKLLKLTLLTNTHRLNKAKSDYQSLFLAFFTAAFAVTLFFFMLFSLHKTPSKNSSTASEDDEVLDVEVTAEIIGDSKELPDILRASSD